MVALIRLFIDIAMLRRGPEDAPHSVPVLVFTAAACFLVGVLLVFTLMPKPAGAAAALAADVLFTVGWFALLMRVFGRPERYVQTTIAILGCQLILTPSLLAVQALATRVPQDGVLVVLVVLFFLANVVWLLAAHARILKQALDQPTFLCIALLVLQGFVQFLLLKPLGLASL